MEDLFDMSKVPANYFFRNYDIIFFSAQCFFTLMKSTLKLSRLINILKQMVSKKHIHHKAYKIELIYNCYISLFHLLYFHLKSNVK